VRQFTYNHYRELIHRLQKNYSFTTFQEGKEAIGQQVTPMVIMRHDIDMELEAAFNMSLIEKDLGITSTYFFMIRCPSYNVFSGKGAEQINNILSAGHHLGLHFDCALYNDISASNIERYISRECQLLKEFFGRQVTAISFHRPGQMELNGITLRKWPNSYEEVFTKDFEYFSDSRGNWARGNPSESEAFSKLKNLHILIHPIWWTEIETEPYNRLLNFVEQTGKRIGHYLSENCQVWNRKQ